jgi:hypothetical protein
MALSQVYTAVIGHVITAARWNNEFGNIYANGVDLAFPATKAVSFAGYTLTLDAAGVSTISSTSAQGFILTPGTKSGTPSVNGNSMTVAANTFTDTNTAGSGTAALWAAVSFRAPTLAATNASVTTTDACTVYIEDPVAGTNETFTETNALYVAGKIKLTGDLRLRGIDSRTATVVEPFTLQMMTSGSPAAGIGTGMAFGAESADEAPSVLGTIGFVFSDVGAGTEDSYMMIKLRRAGAAAAEAFRWTCTNAFSAIWTHANTANRTYTLQNRDMTIGVPTIEVLTSGTEWVVPTGVTRVDVEIFGASGGGGGGGDVSGSGGAGGAGGTTSFDSAALSTTGGAGGYGGTSAGGASSISDGAVHGVGSGGTVNRTGGGQSGGNGGEGYTAAGAGDTNTAPSGGTGGDGGYVRHVQTVTPGETITYAIGAAGAAGSPATNAGAGIIGQAGVIVLTY